MENTINVKDLHVSYHGKNVLHDITLTLPIGKLIGIIGPNGAGKSTFMKAVLGLIPTDKGTVSFAGETIKKTRKKIAYVPQRASIDWDFPILVKDTVLLGTYPKIGLFKRPTKEDKAWADECLKMVGMEEYRQQQIGELSGGQQQRVFLARALAQKADYFFLDEPFVGIDVSSEDVIISILKKLRDEGKSVFVVHHDLSKVENYFEELILLNKTIYKAGAVKQVLEPKLMQQAYNSPFLPFDKEGAFA